MGMSGFTIVYQKANQFLGYPKIISTVLVFITSFIFMLISLTYFIKFLKYREMVKLEFYHPVKINFFPAMSISLLLLGIVYHDINHTISGVAWYIGAPLHLFFTLYVIKYWITRNLDIETSNPAWFIPIVGNVLVPINGVYYGGISVSQFYFSIGIFFWIVLFTIILYRIIFHHQLAQKFLPTLFIFIAPASIGYVSYVKINHAINSLYGSNINSIHLSLDFYGHMLYDIAMFFTILVFFMFSLFRKLNYSITWWAYTFPMASVTIASILNYQISKTGIEKGLIKSELMFQLIPSDEFFYYISTILVTMTTLLIIFVTYKTLMAIKKRDVCIAE
jgi:tellurite resistance protein